MSGLLVTARYSTCRLPMEMKARLEAAQPDGVDGEEVAGEDRFALRPQEVAPGSHIAPWRRRQAGPGENVADGASGDGGAQLVELASDPQVAPARILVREPQDQFAHISADRRPAWAAVRIGPAPSR